MRLNFKNKRALSTVVVTVLLILITIAAVALLSGAIIPFVKTNLNKSTECLNYKDYYKFQENIDFKDQTYKFNCNSGELYGFSVFTQGGKANIESPIGFAVVFSGDEVDKVEVKSGGVVQGLKVFNSTNSLSIPELGGIRTYVYNSTKTFNTIDLYPLLKNGRLCDKSDSIKIINCEANVILN